MLHACIGFTCQIFLIVKKIEMKNLKKYLKNDEFWSKFDPVYIERTIILKNRPSSLFYIRNPSTWCKKSEKSDKWFLREITCIPTHKPEFIGSLVIQKHLKYYDVWNKVGLLFVVQIIDLDIEIDIVDLCTLLAGGNYQPPASYYNSTLIFYGECLLQWTYVASRSELGAT